MQGVGQQKKAVDINAFVFIRTLIDLLLSNLQKRDKKTHANEYQD